MNGLYAVSIGIFYFICDIKNKYKALEPIIAFGCNPILIYMTLEILGIKFWSNVVTSSVDGVSQIQLVENITFTYITPIIGTRWDSLAFSVLYMFVWLIIAMIMYKKKIFIKL
jgi:predicted acyltransferase